LHSIISSTATTAIVTKRSLERILLTKKLLGQYCEYTTFESAPLSFLPTQRRRKEKQFQSSTTTGKLDKGNVCRSRFSYSVLLDILIFDHSSSLYSRHTRPQRRTCEGRIAEHGYLSLLVKGGLGVVIACHPPLFVVLCLLFKFDVLGLKSRAIKSTLISLLDCEPAE
jgi:hypothetical protein